MPHNRRRARHLSEREAPASARGCRVLLESGEDARALAELAWGLGRAERGALVTPGLVWHRPQRLGQWRAAGSAGDSVTQALSWQPLDADPDTLSCVYWKTAPGLCHGLTPSALSHDGGGNTPSGRWRLLSSRVGDSVAMGRRYST
jgi:hypothetical protein